MSNHTPGPWHLTDHISPHISIYAGGETVDGIEKPTKTIVGPIYKASGKEFAANARLIAAAPEMLALLKNEVSTADSQWDCEVRALIARVEGAS